LPSALRVEIFVADLDVCADFYTRVLGFAVTKRYDGYIAMDRDGVRIGAVLARQSVDRASRSVPTGVEIVIEVDDVRAEASRVRAADWPVESDVEVRPWGLTDFRIHDPDGYYLRVTSA
jgi:catechol 2,3-dioxygenase-like lactoylglutathione lyase family enzyme